MNNMITVKTNSERPTVSGRELHQKLEIATPYVKWLQRMCEYGFEEGQDFWTFLSESSGGRPAVNHDLTISMAKEICMIQRTDLGRQFRQYFIEVENQWNSPESVLSRALQIANVKLLELERDNQRLLENVMVQEQQISELSPKASYYDLVLQCTDAISISVIAKDYGMTAKKMNTLLHQLKVQFKQGGIWLLYKDYQDKGYTSTKTYHIEHTNQSRIHTYWTQKGRLFIYDLLKQEGILPQIEKEEF